MKIAYVNVMFNPVVGIENKIKFQAKTAKKENLSIDFIILNTEIERYLDKFKMIKIKMPKNRILFLIKRWFFRYSVIEKSVDWVGYDFIVLRYPYMDFSAMGFVKRFGNKIITEHHADEISELKVAFKNPFPNFKCFYKVFIMILICFERLYAPTFLSKVRGIIGVTDEIRQLKVEESNNHNSITISNGIDVDSIPFTKFKRFNGKNLNIIFVSSFFTPWQGLDRVLNGLKNYNYDVKIVLHLVGDISEEDKIKVGALVRENVEIRLLGKKTGFELDNIFTNSNLAVSALAVFRKGIKEACALKTREYMARGIPFIYGYDDVDLEGNEYFAMKITLGDSAVDFKEVINFAESLYNKKDVSKEMRQIAKQKFDWSDKLRCMYDFVLSSG